MGKLLDIVKDATKVNLSYSVPFSLMRGITNAVANASDFVPVFLRTTVVDFGLGLPANYLYPLLFRPVKNVANNAVRRVYSHAVNLSLNYGFFIYHNGMGTEDPLISSLPSVVVGTIMTEYNIHRMEKNLEEKLQKQHKFFNTIDKFIRNKL